MHFKDIYLRVENKVFWSANVLAVVHSGSVYVGKGSVAVSGQRARDLELLDDHLEDKITDFRFIQIHFFPV